ncbi:exodeoxyribonuclease III [Patescibacteria group bacterium]|jgi:exodeoxyribonuclease-3|nr:exodeoxyribonuclease III [Patescibacteria group bacterium]
MKVVSWNVNGARAVHRKGAWDTFVKRCGDADVIGLQELKATPEQLPEEMGDPAQFNAFFNVPTQKKGYSGVALYVTEEPDRVLTELDVPDTEGRFVAAVYERRKLVIANVYFPNGGGGEERMAYKLDYYDAFLSFIENWRRAGYSVLFMGDVNAAHEPIDLAHPTANEGTPGYNPDVRAWIDEVVRAGYTDTFRHLHPRAATYSYWDLKTRARERDVGWRIDYVFCSNDLLPQLTDAAIHGDIFGSDHCPVSATIAE